MKKTVLKREYPGDIKYMTNSRKMVLTWSRNELANSLNCISDVRPSFCKICKVANETTICCDIIQKLTFTCRIFDVTFKRVMNLVIIRQICKLNQF